MSDNDEKGKQNIKILYENLNIFMVNQLKETEERLISKFVKILKYFRDEHMGEEELDAEIKKWEEKLK